VRGIDLVHAHSPFVTGWMAAAYARNKRIPLVFTYHTRLDAYAHYAPFDRGTTERAMVELTRRYANAADAVVVPTPAMETRLRALGVHAPIAVVPSAIDVERFAAGRRSALVRARLGAPGGEPLALVVSRLGVEKNVELALDALARLPELRLAIVGEGPHRQALEERAQRLGVAGRVRFTGALARERLPDVYASVDAFVFPSTTDTQGLVLAEALAAGLPVVAAQSEASRDVLGEGGRIVAADPAALAPALAEAIAAGRDQSAVHLAFDRYTVELQTRRILELYREVLAARAA
jgi:glycosyltransferase involved in cell wall biosynthesis